jgi:hypothetical protein
MSWGQCFSGSNNIHFNMPPIMNDGRNYASWQPDAVINNRIQQKEGIQSNWQYRQYLQNNGQQIIHYNNLESCYELGVPTHYDTSKSPASNVPYKFNSVFDTGKPGFGYCTSNLKNVYLSREQLNARLVAPSLIIKNS